MQRADVSSLGASPPRTLKLTEASLAATQPNQESLSLLLRDADDLSGTRIEFLRPPGPLADQGDPLLFEDAFTGQPAGVVFRERFGSSALGHYRIVNQGTSLGPSAWLAAEAEIAQTSGIYGGSLDGAALEMPGTVALLKDRSWGDLRIRAQLRSDTKYAIGIVFRYRDDSNFYRFSMDSEWSYRRLVKCVAGRFKILWKDDVGYVPMQPYELVVEAAGDEIVGYLDGQLLFALRDSDIDAGTVGFYCWQNQSAHFQSLEVETVDAPRLLWAPPLDDLAGLEVVDDPGADSTPSAWTAAAGVVKQTSAISSSTSPDEPGTYLVGGQSEWEDVAVSTHVTSNDDGVIGLLARYVDNDNYYRFSMSRTGSYRRLLRKVSGAVSVLWQDTQSLEIGRTYNLTLSVDGDELRGVLDGVTLFAVRDSALKRGRVALYTNGNAAARFERLLVTDVSRRVGRWRIRDETSAAGPSSWFSRDGTLRQTAAIGGLTAPDYPGTIAVAGEATWSDYRLSAEMRSDDDGGIGLAVRYLDEDNYYLLALDHARNEKRLVRRKNGTALLLWRQAGGHVVGRPSTIVLEAIGSRLVGYLDGARLFDITDTDHPSGRIGLYASLNSGARFEQVEVTRPPLNDYALFRDDFAGGTMNGWDVANEGTLSAPSNWEVSQGVLNQTSDIYELPLDRDTLSKHGTDALVGDPTWTDIVLTLRLRSLDNDAVGVLVRYTDANHYYRFSMDSERGYRRLVKNVGGAFTRLWEDAVSYDVGREYELTITAFGTVLRGFLDGVPLFVVEDSDLAAGRVGLYTWGNADARFRSVRVYPAEQAFDRWLLEDSFDFAVPQRWTFVDEGTQGGPSDWKITSGELRQTSGIEDGGAPTDPMKLGTNALAGDASWSDYRLSVRLRTDADGAIGIFARYADAQHWYRFSMDRQSGYRRLLKRVGREAIKLWEDTLPFDLECEYLVTLDCIGDRVTGYVDGVELFSVEDADVASGRIGLYAWHDTDARFTEVRVAPATWQTYYRFGQEARMPAGTNVRVFSGNEASALAAEPGVERQFRALLDDPGEILFPPMGVEARVISADGTIQHARRFLPDSAYAPALASVLRKADGTSAFVLPAAPFVPGNHRFELTYRRDNRAADPANQVFRQAGDANPEHVRLDVPWQTR